ncbi:hypothetical protein O0L34_g3703 [Tuta absoluta]|nr:hypothetical protein O0L34_g3703 [Tuta absoluta]
MSETEAPPSEPMPSSSEPVEAALEPPAAEEAVDRGDEGPSPKKRKTMPDKEGSEKLEHRLGGILCCAVCLDLPPAAVFQCTNGHLMCAPCFTHLLADARLRDEAATCPNCRVEISKTSASRNLAVEKTVSELPSECKYCTKVFPRHSLQHHEGKTCEDRLTTCQYACIGCPWRGPWHESAAHAAQCAHPAKSAADVVAVLAEKDKQAQEAAGIYNQIIDLLSYEKITFNDLQLKPYRTEEFVHKLYYETSRFSAFGQQWVVKAYVNKNQRDPTQSSTREITYQLILKSKCIQPLSLQWVVLRGPYGEAGVAPRVAHHAFAEDAQDAAPLPLPLNDPADTNRLLSNKAIHFRLIMFLSSK